MERSRNLDSMTVLPNRRRPRLVIHRRDAAAAAAGLVAFGRAQTGWDRTLIRIAGMSVRAGLGRVMPVSPEWSRVAAGIEDRSRAALGLRDVAMSFRVSTERPNHKPVGCVVDVQTQQVVAFAKLGVDPSSRELVAEEERILRSLWAGGVPPSLRIPQVLSRDDVDGVLLLLISPISPSGTNAAPVRSLPLSATLDVAGLSPATSGTLATSTYWQVMASRLDRLERADGGPITSGLREAFDHICETAGDRVLTFAFAHGDWNPANMAWVDGQLGVYDWERASHDRPSGIDAIRFLISTAEGRSVAEHVRSVLNNRSHSVETTGVRGSDLLLLVVLDAMEMAYRYREARLHHQLRMVDPGHWRVLIDLLTELSK